MSKQLIVSMVVELLTSFCIWCQISVFSLICRIALYFS
ncbi:unnamed protein product, partial [Vitis vinifera]|uniref:Uncharacterized protein n=1 Tax=Vitis vinifera TaxID=29760 RepID=D7STC1_VITVI